MIDKQGFAMFATALSKPVGELIRTLRAWLGGAVDERFSAFVERARTSTMEFCLFMPYIYELVPSTKNVLFP
jgi:hypothetical protein